MPRGRSKTLTDAELRVMDALWIAGASTVAQVVDALPEGDKVAYNTVLTTLRILEEKATSGTNNAGAHSSMRLWSDATKRAGRPFST